MTLQLSQSFWQNPGDWFFSFLPPLPWTSDGKVNQLNNAGFCYEQLVKNDVDSSSSTSSDGGDPETLAHSAQISNLSPSCAKGTAKTSLQSWKKSPTSKSSKKT